MRTSEIWNNLKSLNQSKKLTEWVKSFVIMEKKFQCDSSNSHSPGHTCERRNSRICLDMRDLNEALEREP